MLDLLLSIPLNSLHKTLHRLVLFCTEFCRLNLHLLQDFLFVLMYFIKLLLISLSSHELGVVVFLDAKEDLFLIAQCHKIFLWFVSHFTPDLFNKSLLLVILFFSHVFYKFKCRCLVTSHVLVPGRWKFLELELLSIFNIKQFLFLSNPHILLLALLFSSAEFFKFLFHLFSCGIIATTFTCPLFVIQ
jgi:hypothetical protein